jgi:transposase
MKKNTSNANAASENPANKPAVPPRPIVRGGKRGSRAKGSAWNGTLPMVHPKAAGIDVAAGNDLWAAVSPNDGRPATQTVRPFAPTTRGITQMAQWLLSEGVTTIAMEATGIYWLPLYTLLCEHGLEVVVVNPRDVKALRKKTDIADAQWLQYLHSVGLLKNSFVPPTEVLAMRGVWRHRDDLVRHAGSLIQHMQKALDMMNLKLHFFIDDITGKTGMAIIDAILAGERDARVMAGLRDYRCKASEEKIAEALEGRWLEHAVFILRQAREQYGQVQEHIAACDALLERQALEQLASMGKIWDMEAELARPAGKPVKRKSRKANASRKPGKNEPRGSAWPELCRALFGVDLMRVPGVGVGVMLALLCEIGVSWKAFASAGQFASWVGLCPNNKISGGKVIRRSVMPGQAWLKNILRHSAASLARNESVLGDYYRRMRARMGPAGANTVVAHKLARILWHMVTYQVEYDETILARLEEGLDERKLKRLKKQAHALKFQLIPLETPETKAA